MLFGKTMESLRKRIYLELVTNLTRAKKLIAKPTTLHWDIISENLVSVRKQKQVRIACKAGLHGYRLFYIPHSNARPIQRYGGQLERVRYVRLSTRPPPPLKDECQGPRQHECSSLAPQEFVVLRAKMYSILLPNGKQKFTAKGVSRRYILKHLHHKDYLRTLKETESTIATFSTLRSQKQQIKTIKLIKKCLSAFDDKRYILNNGMTTLAYGHYKIAQIKST